jgi:muramoyltetrapeptide carboxypeptidase
VVVQLPKLDAQSLEQCGRVLGGQAGWGPTIPTGARVLRPGSARGVLVGGNLAVLASLAGTRWALDLRRAVVLLEDTGEPAFRVDRMVRQLVHACGLAEAAALLLGDFTDVADGERCAIDAVWAELADAMEGPVLAGLPVGHGARNHMVPLGMEAVLDTALDLFAIDSPWSGAEGALV